MWLEIVCAMVLFVNTSVLPVSLGSFCGGRITLAHHSASLLMSNFLFSLFQFIVLLSNHLLEDNVISL